MFDEFLSPWTLLIKSLGLVLAVASGLSLGKEVNVYFICMTSLNINDSVLGTPCTCFLLHGFFNIKIV